MATLERRGGGWRLRWRDPDGSPRSRQCPTKPVAQALRREVEEAAALGRRWEPASRVAVPKLADLIIAYLDDLCRVSRQNTVNSHRSQLSAFLAWCHARGVTEPRRLTRSLLEEFDAWRASSGIGSATRRLTLGIVRRWWSWCAEHEDHRAHLGPPPRINLPARVVVEVVAPYWEEVDKVVELALHQAEKSATHEAIARVVILLRGTGLRISQVLRLRWDDLNPQLGTLRIRPELGKTPSERAGRTLPLAPWLLRWLLTLERPSDLVVSVPNHRRAGVKVGDRVEFVVTTASWRVRQLWEALEARPEVYERRPDHAFRKALRTELLHARCSSEAIEYWCGRSTGTPGRYTDPRAHDLVEIARAIPEPPCVRGVSVDKVATLPRPLSRLA
jgi:integrase